jgi:hypothetical protein
MGVCKLARMSFQGDELMKLHRIEMPGQVNRRVQRRSPCFVSPFSFLFC